MDAETILIFSALFAFLLGGIVGSMQGSTYQQELDNDVICGKLYPNDLSKYKQGLTLDLNTNTRYIKEVK